jgi:predicted PurR-regulated permease PerM
MTPTDPKPARIKAVASSDGGAGGRLSARHYLWVVAGLVAIALLLHWLGPILTPFLIGTMFAYLGNPAVNWGARHRVPRMLGTLCVLIVMILIVLVLVLILAPLVHTEFGQLMSRLPDMAAALYGTVGPWLNDNLGINMSFDMASFKQLVSDNAESAQAVGLKLLSGLKTGGGIVLGLLINLVLVPVVMFYLLRDWNAIIARIDELTPRRWVSKTRKIASEIDMVLAEFVRGQLSVMGVLAAYYVIGLSLVGLKLAIPIGILTGLLVFIPYVGFGLGLVLGVLAALLQWHGWPAFALVLAVYGVGQLLEGYVLVPWLVGDRIGLHPLAVIFALLAFGQLFGFAGVLLALPVSASLLVALRHLRAAYQESPLYH